MVWLIASWNAVLTLVGWMLKDWTVFLGNGFLTVVFTIAAYQIDRLRRDAETAAWRRELERLAKRGPAHGKAASTVAAETFGERKEGYGKDSGELRKADHQCDRRRGGERDSGSRPGCGTE